MTPDIWRDIYQINWKQETKREYVGYTQFQALVEDRYKNGHLAQSFSDRNEWCNPDVFKHEIRGYWEHLYIGGMQLRHIVSNRFDDTQNTEAQRQGFIPDTGRRANAIEQKIFKELNGVTERQAFGYSEPQLNKCVPKQLYYINSQWVNKKIKYAGKVDFCSHYPANMCGPLPNWARAVRIEGTRDPTPDYPFAFYIKSGHCAEYHRFDTHWWRDEPISGDLFGKNYTSITPDKDITILCPEARHRLDSTIELIYNKKAAGECIEDLPAKTILTAAIGYKHLQGANNTRNRLYHLAAICIARANQAMIDLYNAHYKTVLQIVVDGMIYMGVNQIGVSEKSLGALHQEITGHSFIMRGINQYMFIDTKSGTCSAFSHSGFDTNISTTALEDIQLWQRLKKS